MSIKAIETRYKGYRFRSRLEARWAVFFDALGIEWEYECEGVATDGVKYLPDFMIVAKCPPFNGDRIFAEVKHIGISLGDDELRKAENTAKSGAFILLLNGSPDANRAWTLLGPFGCHLAAFRDYDSRIFLLEKYLMQSLKMDRTTGNFSFDTNERGLKKLLGRGLLAVVSAARSARFEFGESGARL